MIQSLDLLRRQVGIEYRDFCNAAVEDAARAWADRKDAIATDHERKIVTRDRGSRALRPVGNAIDIKDCVCALPGANHEMPTAIVDEAANDVRISVAIRKVGIAVSVHISAVRSVGAARGGLGGANVARVGFEPGGQSDRPKYIQRSSRIRHLDNP